MVNVAALSKIGVYYYNEGGAHATVTVVVTLGN